MTDTVGTVVGTGVVMVNAAADVLVMQCVAAYAGECWPSFAGTCGPSVALGSLPPTGLVWASIAGANAKWVPVSSVTIPAPAPAPVPTPTPTPVPTPVPTPAPVLPVFAVTLTIAAASTPVVSTATDGSGDTIITLTCNSIAVNLAQQAAA